MKILVVDDDVIILELLSEILFAQGYKEVTRAQNGKVALEIILDHEDTFDCILLDIQMPDMDGIEVCRLLREMPEHKMTPIIMLTTTSDRLHIDRAFAAGATDYAVKPFEVGDLMARIKLAERTRLDRHRAQKVVTSKAELPKVSFDDPLPLRGQVNGFVDATILKNYAKITHSQRTFPMTAVAIHIPQLQELHEGLSTDDYRLVLADIGEVIAESLVGTQAFMTYHGAGTFLCICNETRLLPANGLRSELAMVLNDGKAVGLEAEDLEFTVKMSPYCSPRATDLVSDLSFITRALDRVHDTNSDRKVISFSEFGARILSSF